MTLLSIDLSDETFIVAPPAVLAQWLRRPAVQQRWWPGVSLVVFMDRGAAGMRWSMTGALLGSTEVWLEPWHDGTLVHWYLRGEPRGGPLSPRAARALRREWTMGWKARVQAWKDEVERGRVPGR